MNIYLFIYMFIYNFSMTIFFWTIFNFITTEFKTLYYFSNFSYNSFTVFILTVLLLSMAGVPPFIGFFSKLFIIIFLLNNLFFLLYSFLIVILLVGLYFYVQNIRFLYSTNFQYSNTPYIFNEKGNFIYYYISLILVFLVTCGVFFMDDIIIFFS